ncbi:hypothetical protein BACSTE_03315 [Bacteroides stercoris ATCC 43183]|uniref:Uncharacterized protein n=1 Tax=Bacteroides stercoris ATCC 43183 TaxID=449673 RepID=B0NUX8_BACSE|nr:hypothetical protein BACSTE_03315 [Bacteroides stercoris ATCC 43183]
MGLQRYKEILQKPEKHLLKTAKDMLRCFFRQLYISAYARTPCLTPGCQTYQDPDVRHAKTRVSDIPRPGCRTYPVRQSGKLASQRESISVKRGENVRTNSRKRQAAKQKTDKMIQPSVFFCYFCIL